MDERPAVAAAGPAGPMVEALGRGHRHQRVVIARHQADARRRRERLRARRPPGGIRRQGEIGDVAGDDDMIDAGGAHVRGQRLEDLRPVQMLRRRRHDSALSWRFDSRCAQREPRLERQVQVGDVRQRDRFIDNARCLLDSAFRPCPSLLRRPAIRLAR